MNYGDVYNEIATYLFKVNVFVVLLRQMNSRGETIPRQDWETTNVLVDYYWAFPQEGEKDRRRERNGETFLEQNIVEN